MTRLGFALAQESKVSLLIYDASGRLVRTLVDRTLEPGIHQVSRDGLLDQGGRAMGTARRAPRERWHLFGSNPGPGPRNRDPRHKKPRLDAGGLIP